MKEWAKKVMAMNPTTTKAVLTKYVAIGLAFFLRFVGIRLMRIICRQRS